MGIARFPDGSPVQVIFPQCEILNTLETRVVELAPIGNPFDLKNSQLGYWEQLDNTKRQIDDVSNRMIFNEKLNYYRSQKKTLNN
mgnify:CR=1 FL=1